MRGSEMAAAAGDAWLKARGLVAGYMPGIDILRDVSVEAVCGQVRCVLGPNGTGKSTLLKVLFGFLPARQGEIRLNGQPMRSVPSRTIRPQSVIRPLTRNTRAPARCASIWLMRGVSSGMKT